MKGIIEFEILTAGGFDFGKLEKDPTIKKEFKNHCRTIAKGLKGHFAKYKMKAKVIWKVKS